MTEYLPLAIWLATGRLSRLEIPPLHCSLCHQRTLHIVWRNRPPPKVLRVACVDLTEAFLDGLIIPYRGLLNEFGERTFLSDTDTLAISARIVVESA